MSSPPFGGWPPPTSPVTSVFSRTGAVIALLGDYAASKITNDSSVSGATVKDALNALTGVVGTLTSTSISNVSGVSGATVTNALNTLATAITTLSGIVSALTSSGIANASGVVGATVTAALNTLNSAISSANAAIAALTSTSITNVSGVAGATVTAALNNASAAINAANAAIAALTSTSIANASSVAGATVTAALNTLLATLPTTGVATRDPIWDPPTTPSADDDEFTTDTLASGVWTMYSTPFTVAATRDVGPIDPTSAPAAGHYRSQCIGSTLFVQVPNSTVFIMTKPFAGALSTKQWWMAGFGAPANIVSGTSNNPLFALNFFKKTGAIPDNANRGGTRTLQNGARLNAFGVVANVTTFDQSTNTWGTNSGFEPDALAAWVDHGASSNNMLGFAYKRGGQNATTPLGQAPQFNAATDYVALTLGCDQQNPPSAGVNSVIYALHFLRRVPVSSGKWIAQS